MNRTNGHTAPGEPAFSPASIAFLYATFFVQHGIVLPYLPVCLKALGFTGAEIGNAMALALVIQLLTLPAWGLWADRTRDSGRLVRWASAGAALGILGVATTGKTWFLACFSLFALGRTPVSPLIDSLALSHPGIGTAGYGRVRRWGSFGFMLAAFFVGMLVDSMDPRGVPALAGAVWVCLLAVATLRRGRAEARLPARISLSRLYGNGAVWAFLVAGAFHAGCVVPFETHFGNHARSVGLPGFWIGISWLLGVGLEILVLTHLDRLIRRIGLRMVLVASFLTGMARWFLTASLDGPGLAGIQVLHGVTSGAFIGASVVWMNRAVPDELRASGQSLLSAVCWGLGGIVSQVACGWLQDRYGGRVLFLLASGFELIPAAIVLCLGEPPEESR